MTCVYNFLVKCVKILLPTNLANTELIQILVIRETSIVVESIRISTELKNTWLYVAVFFFFWKKMPSKCDYHPHLQK